MRHMVQKRDNLNYRIILLLLKEESHVRGIAKKLGISHSTILRRLDELSKRNVLDYRKEGRNKIFFIRKSLQARNYVYNAERYKQIMLLSEYPQLNIIAEEILRKRSERMIIIFGSYAKFKAKKDSDIDVYVETIDAKVKEQVESIHSSIRVKIGKFDLNSELIEEIVKDHVILRGVEEFHEKAGLFE